MINDYDVERFIHVAADFGMDKYGYVVALSVDHSNRFHDDASFRDYYAQAEFVLLDSRFLSYVLRLTKGIRAKVCTGSDLTAQPPR